MKQLLNLTAFLLAMLNSESLWAQCQHITLTDSSFEFLTEFYGYPGVPEMGKWFYDDGVLSSDNAFSGDKSACSNGGGAFQFVKVDSNTTYYVSAYILNGANESAPYPHFRINWVPHTVSVPTNNWTLISTSFDSGSDTMAIVGFYSMGACFDEFRVTCNPLTSADFIEDRGKPYTLSSRSTNNSFFLDSEENLDIEIWSVNGSLIAQIEESNQIAFGANLSKGMYVLKVKTDSGIWVERVVKW
ncbi:MAG: T9SS type A sorting domain-containing protein [Bacteroidetes bacterium]|nr:T9SS type A sorting domain-containing protein [Bacteroidota bacterium]